MHALTPLAYRPLPLGAVRPAGWLRRQLQVQADGLSGHLDEFWPDIARSGWIGGDAEGWERGPYWLDGVVPLAYLLDDAGLKAKVTRWMDYLLEHQQADGWLGPVTDPVHRLNHDPWPVFPALKALTQYHEATGDERVLPALTRFLRRLDALLDEQPLRSWARFRWADLLVAIAWRYDRAPEPWLVALGRKARAQGYDWAGSFANFRFTGRTAKADLDAHAASADPWRKEAWLAAHVVNNAMSVTSPAVAWRFSGDETDRAAWRLPLETLDRWHGQVNGMFSGDEHLAGREPYQGSELCAVVELMYSLEQMLAITGDSALADRLEFVAYNALPATFTPDMWAHQYDQQANQVLCRIADDRVWTTNGPEANLYGLEPHYGCCTANLSQGWPKFAAHLWMASPDGGLAAMGYAPCTVVAEAGGRPVRLEVTTGYPFEDQVRLTVHVAGPTRFPLHLRIPGRAAGAALTVDGTTSEPAAGGFATVERTWREGDEVTLTLPAAWSRVPRLHGAVALVRGPLLFALHVGETWRQVRGEAPHADWEVDPATPWAYALDPEATPSIERRPVGGLPFSPDGAPLRATLPARRVTNWPLAHHAAGPVPDAPELSAEPAETVTLLPYGCTNLRVAELPVAPKG